MKKIVKYFLVPAMLSLSILALAGCDNKQAGQSQQQSSTVQPQQSPTDHMNNLTINVYDKKGYKIFTKTVKTKKTNLFKIMDGMKGLKFVSEDAQNGKFIVSLLGISYDNDYYWMPYINGRKYEDSVSSYEIKNNDFVNFYFKKVGE